MAALQSIDELIDFVSPTASPIAAQWSAKKIRNTFYDFFRAQSHTHIPSSSVIPFDDKSIMFTNAGMNQFKPIFLGTVDPRSEFAKLKRAANSQKCIRAGGKHNDLDVVGRDTYHHTFFEMLGNWSFGDYFKVQAIEMAWELLVEVYGLDPSRLYVTYFEGNEMIEPDLEAKEIWSHYLPQERILAFNAKENFWEMGETGPCGPCTEIHYDRIGGRDAANLVNNDAPETCNEVIEIWNLVFIQFNREASGKLSPLPNKHVDTGMGFERIAAILQDKPSNYDTDVFSPIIDAISRITGARPYTGLMGADDVDQVDTAYRVIADHIRALTFAVADGGRLGPDGANYVLRRILRRAVRYGRTKLDAKDSFLFQLVAVVVEEFGDVYSGLREAQEMIERVIENGEKRFAVTLDVGERETRKVVERHRLANELIVSGRDAWKIVSTFGYPLDLIVLVAEEVALQVDTNAFAKCLKQSVAAQAHRESEQSQEVISPNLLQSFADLLIPDTDCKSQYEKSPISSVVVGIVADGELIDIVGGDDGKVGILFDRTAFYAESGGQVSDTGALSWDEGDGNVGMFAVEDVQKYGGYVIHFGQILNGEISLGQEVVGQVNNDRRDHITSNHTMTHVLNWALRKVVGHSCNQRGSVVDENRTRFDFSLEDALTEAQVADVERCCQEVIDAALDVNTEIVPYLNATNISALRAVFGEKYPKEVRVVAIGANLSDILASPRSDEWFKFSVELCGGTHLGNTSQARRFVLVSQSLVSAGVRRLEGVSYTEAQRVTNLGGRLIELFQRKVAQKTDEDIPILIRELEEALRNRLSIRHREKLYELLAALSSEQKSKSKMVRKMQENRIRQSVVQLVADNQQEGSKFVVKKFELGADAKSLKFAVKSFVRNSSSNVPIFAYSRGYKDNQTQIIAELRVPAESLYGTWDARAWGEVLTHVTPGRGGGSCHKYSFVGAETQRLHHSVQTNEEGRIERSATMCVDQRGLFRTFGAGVSYVEFLELSSQVNASFVESGVAPAVVIFNTVSSYIGKKNFRFDVVFEVEGTVQKVREGTLRLRSSSLSLSARARHVPAGISFPVANVHTNPSSFAEIADGAVLLRFTHDGRVVTVRGKAEDLDRMVGALCPFWDFLL